MRVQLPPPVPTTDSLAQKRSREGANTWRLVPLCSVEFLASPSARQWKDCAERGGAPKHALLVGAIERGRDALVYEQLGALAANGPLTDSCFSKLIMVGRPFALSLIIP